MVERRTGGSTPGRRGAGVAEAGAEAGAEVHGGRGRGERAPGIGRGAGGAGGAAAEEEHDGGGLPAAAGIEPVDRVRTERAAVEPGPDQLEGWAAVFRADR